MPKRWKVNEAIVVVVLALAVGAMVWWAVTLKQTRPSPIRERSGSPETTRIEKPTRPVPLSSTRLATNPAASVSGPTSLVTRQPTTPVPGSKQPVASPTPAVRSLAGPDNFPRPVVNVFEAQLALARLGISPGSIDGVSGSRTRAALLAFQQRENLPATGELDALTRSRLLLAEPPLTNYIVTSNDLARLRPLGSTWLEKSQQDRLDYETILEFVAEKAQSSPSFIQRLNPAINWSNVVAGTSVTIPNVFRPDAKAKAAFARIHLETRTLQVFDDSTNLVAHFPCTIAAFAEKRPVGELHVEVIAQDPNYTFDPENFPESPEARQLDRKLILQPGPNNPVGTVWIGLDKPGYGIHGTPRPEQVGRAESHGCFRLANWNAQHFMQLAWVGMPVYIEP